MTVVAVIPARSGSKGVPGKNLRRVGGVPLVARAVASARASLMIDRVLVSTDDEGIAAAARTAGAEVIDRPAELAGDEASSESALLHALTGVEADVLVFIQATSPFIDLSALDDAIERVENGHDDVVFSAVETYEFLWTAAGEGVNHDRSARPRRQDREPHYRETGAFYVLDVAGFRTAGHRFFGRVGIAVVDERTAIEIDTADELELSNAIAPILDGESRPGLIDVDAVVTDFDGVHTDDRVLIGADGAEYVTTSRSDGMGVQMLREAGVPVLILSTEKNPVVAARAAKLRVEVMQGLDDKAAALREWSRSHGIPLDRIAYLGNDVNDLGCLAIVGWPVAVPGSAAPVIAAARVVLQAPGGYGAVRELAELVLRSLGPHPHSAELTESAGLTQSNAEHTKQTEEPWLYPSVATM